MAIRFFKKAEPKNAPVLSNGAKCEFTTLDHVTGYFANDNSFVHDELARLMGEGRYGMTEITAEEFTRDYVEKKKALNGRVSKPLWREEIAPRQVSADTVFTPKAKGAVAAVEQVLVPGSIPEVTKPQSQVVAAEPLPSPSNTPTAEFKPTVAKRVKKPKA